MYADQITGYIREITLRALIDDNTLETYHYKYDLVGRPKYLKKDPRYKEALLTVSIVLGIINFDESVELRKKRTEFKYFLTKKDLKIKSPPY